MLSNLSWSRGIFSLFLSLFISVYGVRRKSLDLSGGLAAVLVGTILTASNGCFCLALLAFFFTSSKLSKFKVAEKKKLEQDHKEGGQRNWVQVICNGGVACVAALCYVQWREGYGELPFYLSSSSPPSQHTLAAMACLAALSCCCGDTWASEVGAVLGGTPRLLTTWKKVPQGTNGGVTLVGITCSLLGGVVVGGAYYIGLFVLVGFVSLGDAMSQSVVILLGGVAGLAGSLVDSFLGATVQYSGFSERHKCVVHRPGKNEEDESDGDVKHISGVDVLDNHAVNLMSSVITVVVVPLVVYAVCITVYSY